MGTKMKKGILKPFRYISNMMDGKEPEMQIGFPTDVKHVAHIGWDGPGSNNNNTTSSSSNNNNNAGGAPSWMKDYHSAPLDSSSFRSESGGTAAANPWASQEIVMDGGSSIGDTSFRDTKSEACGGDVGGGDSPPSPGTRRSRRHRSRGSATSSMDVTGAEGGAEEKKKEKGKKGTRKNRKTKDKSAGDDASATCQDLPAVPKKSNRGKNKGSSEGTAAKDATTAAPEVAAAATTPPAVDDD